MLYLHCNNPLDDPDNSFDDFKFNSSVNFTAYDPITISLDSEIEQQIKIISLSANIITYYNNFCTLTYIYKGYQNIIKQETIKLKIEKETICPIGLDIILENSK